MYIKAHVTQSKLVSNESTFTGYLCNVRGIHFGKMMPKIKKVNDNNYRPLYGLPIFEMVHKITLAKEIDAMDLTVKVRSNDNNDPVLNEMLRNLLVTKEQAKRIMGNTGTDYIAIHRMPSQAQDAVTHAYMNSMLQVFRFPPIVGGVMLVLALLMKNIRYP